MNTIAKYAVIATNNIDDVAGMLTTHMGLKFDGHDSGYWGEYFLYEGPHNKEIRIYENRDPMWRAELDIPEEEFFEYEYKTYKVLISSTLPSDAQIKLFHLLQQLFPNSVQIGSATNA